MSKILIISDKKPGHLNQSIAFAKLKGYEYDIVEVDNHLKPLTYLLDFLSFYINLFSLHVKNDYAAVVSTGSSTYYANRYLSKSLHVKSIAIMLPRGFRLSGFDYIVAQKHDNPPKKDNIIELPINLSINEPKGYLKKRDKKSIGIIIGGDNKIFKMSKKIIKEKLDEIFNTFPTHLKYITTSRRTPKDVEELLESYDFDYKLIYSHEPNINPIPDFLEICDELFITIDSTSMLSEAKANSNASLHVIEVKSEREDTKFHTLAKNVSKIKGKFDYTPYLKRIKI